MRETEKVDSSFLCEQILLHIISTGNCRGRGRFLWAEKKRETLFKVPNRIKVELKNDPL